MNSNFKHSPRFKKLVKSLDSLLSPLGCYRVFLSDFSDKIIVSSDDELFSFHVIGMISLWCKSMHLDFVIGTDYLSSNHVTIRIYEES